MDRATLYKAVISRDKRFDGRFYVGVRTTGIYCRPVCPARPLLKNVGFYKSQAEAEGAGFRPCLRCRPDLSPSSPLFQGTGAVVQRALRLISEGVADECVEVLADRVGLTGRHLRRLFAEHVGASPVEVAASKRLHLARLLLAQSKLPITDVALAAGFRSLRRFNQSFVERYKRAPRDFRKENFTEKSNDLVITIPVLEPYDWLSQISFLDRHSLPGIEKVKAGVYERVLSGGGLLRVERADRSVKVTLCNVPVEDLRVTLERVRHLFDLDHNPASTGRALKGLRVPGAFCGFETAITIILSQLITVAGARGAARRLITTCGKPGKKGEHFFPDAATLASADLPFLPRAKAGAIRELARLVAAHKINLTRSAPLEETRAMLLAIPGIGPWTVELIALRCLADPDAFPASDLVVARALQKRLVQPDGWRPWRAYLTCWLWKKYKTEEII